MKSPVPKEPSRMAGVQASRLVIVCSHTEVTQIFTDMFPQVTRAPHPQAMQTEPSHTGSTVLRAMYSSSHEGAVTLTAAQAEGTNPGSLQREAHTGL